jgi:alkylation response protein AidB-like acyl-CoA dehydrogenase
MELHLTSEQTLLRDSAAKFVEAAGPKVARGFREQDPSFAPERLRQAAKLGWLGMLVPASADGLGLGLTELALVLEQAGRGLVCEPIGLAAISAAALAQGRAPHPMLERVMTGAALVVPALQESGYDDDPLAPRTRLAGDTGSLRLTGQKTFVCADRADGFLVSASWRDGPVLCQVARNARGVTLATTQTVEGRKLATLGFAETPADFIAPRHSTILR